MPGTQIGMTATTGKNKEQKHSIISEKHENKCKCQALRGEQRGFVCSGSPGHYLQLQNQGGDQSKYSLSWCWAVGSGPPPCGAAPSPRCDPPLTPASTIEAQSALRFGSQPCGFGLQPCTLDCSPLVWIASWIAALCFGLQPFGLDCRPLVWIQGHSQSRA